jgi:hypothetical protein
VEVESPFIVHTFSSVLDLWVHCTCLKSWALWNITRCIPKHFHYWTTDVANLHKSIVIILRPFISKYCI